MGRADWLFGRSRGATLGANLMQHQSGKDTVRTDQLGTCGVGGLGRQLLCRKVTVPGTPTPQRFLYPATDCLATGGGLGLQSGVDETLRMTIPKPLGSWQRQR